MRVATGGLALAMLAATVAAQIPEAWRNWRYSAPIVIAPEHPGGLVSVTVPPYVTARAARGWTDLRVIDSAGGERPFVLHARMGGRSFDRRSLPLLEPGIVDGQYQQAIVDTGDDRVLHNSMRLGIDTNGTLLTRVEVAVSGDLVDWRVVRDDAPIYLLRAEGMGENTDVRYPDSVSRYVRIRVLDGTGSYTLRSVEIGAERSAVAERVAAPVTLGMSTGPAGESVWTTGDEAGHVPMSRIEFESAVAPFVRPVALEASDDGRRWRRVATGEILKSSDAAGSREWLTIDFAEEYAARWRITVDNRSDAPVADLRARLLTAPRHVVFRADADESYRLLYGQPRAEVPRYDLARVTPVEALDAAAAATLGPEGENAAWVDPSPWTERYDAVLWAALVLAVLVLGGVAVRTMRSATPGGPLR